MKLNYNQKLYAFYLNCEYHLITRISSKKYGVVPLFTDSYGIEEVECDTLEECINLCKKNKWKVEEFNTYKELFEWFVNHEYRLEKYDFWQIKNITGRHFYIEEIAIHKAGH